MQYRRTAGARDLCHLALYAPGRLAYSQTTQTLRRITLFALMQEMLYPASVVLMGYTVLGITGFGSALLIVPLLAWHWPLPEVVTLTLLLDLPASLLLGGMNRMHIQWQELKRLLPGVVIGALLGLWLAQQLASSWPLIALGVYVMAVGLLTLRATSVSPLALPPLWSLAAGGAIGLVEMLFGTAGPLIVAWLTRRLPDVLVLRATTSAAITVSTCAVLLTMTTAGRLSQVDLWWRWLSLIPTAIAGVLAGQHVSRHVPSQKLRQAISLLLVISGLALVNHALPISLPSR